jgi:hypothetical protein
MAFDIGVTTGYAALSNTGQILELEDIPDNVTATRIVSLVVSRKPRFVVFEKALSPTISQMNRSLAEKQMAIYAAVSGAYWCEARQWKPSLYAKAPTPKKFLGQTLSKHQRDAIRIAAWYLGHVLGGQHGDYEPMEYERETLASWRNAIASAYNGPLQVGL